MTASTTGQWIRSSKRNPCPICQRVKDSSCGVRDDGSLVSCHYGNTHHPPIDLRSGDVVQGIDGMTWAYTGDDKDGRTAMFTLHKPRDTAPSKIVPIRRRDGSPLPLQPAPLPPALSIARLPSAAPLTGSPYAYSATQRVQRIDKPGGKTFRCEHLAGGTWRLQKGPDPWPAWCETEAATHGRGSWVLELEGERCVGIARSGGAVAITQPGHDHGVAQIEPRYRRLQAAGVSGIVFVGDHDTQGDKRASQSKQAAAAARLPFLHLPAVEIWPDLPPGGSIDDAHGDPVELVADIEAAAANALRALEATAAPTGEPTRGHSRPIRLEHHEILSRLPEAVGGQPRLNVRTRDVHLGASVISADDASRLYLRLSSPAEKWAKEPTFDAVQYLAGNDPFDPVLEELERITAGTEPLPLEEWHRLDLLLFNITDPITAAFMPRFLVAAVARLYKPGCQADQTPVLIGPQGIGKTQTGRILFGSTFFGDGLTHRFDVDDVTRLQRVWALELSEVDGITRRTDQEALKAFLTRQTDIERRKYGKGTEAIPRRSVFWGTSNGAPLRDLSGSRRFVCIPLPNRPLPVEAVASVRDALWSRAIERYQSGEMWYSSTEEAAEITDRNADHQQVDPWAEEVADFLERRKLTAPVKIGELMDLMEVARSQRTPTTAIRLRQLVEANGWEQRRPRINGRKVQGFFPV